MKTQMRKTVMREDVRRPWDAIDLNRSNEHACLVLRYKNGESAIVSGAEDLSRLIALANDALPHDDPRKFTRADARLLTALVAAIEVQDGEFSRLVPLFNALYEKLGALLESR